MPELPTLRTCPINRFRQFGGQTTAVVILNDETGIDCFAAPPDQDAHWYQHLREGDEVTVEVREKSGKHANTYIGQLVPLAEQPSKLRTAIRNRERDREDLRRSDLMLPPQYAKALQFARKAAGDPDTATYASRIVMAHLGPVLACMKEEN